MGSGEGDAIRVDLIEDRFNSTSSPNIGSLTTDIWTSPNTWPNSTVYLNSPSTVYLYQIKCPKCSAMNFMQLETIVPCKKCKSRIKATQQKYDYEVPVEL